MNIESFYWAERHNNTPCSYKTIRTPESCFIASRVCYTIQNKVKLIQPKIEVNTIHGVKGGEADNVILFTDVTKVVYEQLYKQVDSELRCLYVACTRAKSNLHIIHARTKHSYADIFEELTNECDF